MFICSSGLLQLSIGLHKKMDLRGHRAPPTLLETYANSTEEALAVSAREEYIHNRVTTAEYSTKFSYWITHLSASGKIQQLYATMVIT